MSNSESASARFAEPKVLLNCSNLHTGGGVAVATSVVSELALIPSAARRITVLASTEVWQNLEGQGVEVDAFDKFVRFDSFGAAAAFQRRPVRNRDFDVVFTVFGPLYKPALGTRSVVGFAQPYVAYPRNSAYSLLSPGARVAMRAKFGIVAGFFAASDLLIVEQEHVRRALRARRLFRNKAIEVVPSVVDSVYFEPSRWEPVDFPARRGDLRLGVVSRDYPHKNLHVLPEVKRILKQAHGLDAEFFVTFPDDEFERSPDYFRQAITNLGTLRLAQCPSFNSQLDGIVFPTLLECFSATPIEALAVGTPLFTSDRSFVRDTVGEHACYFDPLDPASIALSIREFFHLPVADRAEAIRAGRDQLVSRHYSSHDRAIQLLEIVDRSARRARPSQGPSKRVAGSR